MELEFTRRKFVIVEQWADEVNLKHQTLQRLMDELSGKLRRVEDGAHLVRADHLLRALIKIGLS